TKLESTHLLNKLPINPLLSFRRVSQKVPRFEIDLRKCPNHFLRTTHSENPHNRAKVSKGLACQYLNIHCVICQRTRTHHEFCACIPSFARVEYICHLLQIGVCSHCVKIMRVKRLDNVEYRVNIVQPFLYGWDSLR